jgi:ABC-2 type transport system permease protein
VSRIPVSSPLWRLTVVRIQMFFREPSAVFWTFGFPILMIVALGIAFRNRPPDPVEAAVEAGPGAEAVRAVLAAAPDVKVSVLEPAETRAALRVGKVAIVVQPGNPRTYAFDPTRPESRLARAVVDDVLQRAQGRRDPAAVSEVRITEPGSRYVDFLVPGLIGLNIMSAGMWGIGYVIVENRQKKLLKRMAATPMKRSEFLISFVFMRMLFIVPELAVLLAFAHYAFAVPLRGSLTLLLAVAVTGAFAFSGLGLLVASRARNTQTVNGLINLVMLPMWLLSGVFFSSSHFPDLLQPVIRVLPLTALNDALRAIMNEGAGVAAVAPQTLLLAAVAAVSFGAALKIFRWS